MTFCIVLQGLGNEANGNKSNSLACRKSGVKEGVSRGTFFLSTIKKCQQHWSAQTRCQTLDLIEEGENASPMWTIFQDVESFTIIFVTALGSSQNASTSHRSAPTYGSVGLQVAKLDSLIVCRHPRCVLLRNVTTWTLGRESPKRQSKRPSVTSLTRVKLNPKSCGFLSLVHSMPDTT